MSDGEAGGDGHGLDAEGKSQFIEEDLIAPATPQLDAQQRHRRVDPLIVVHQTPPHTHTLKLHTHRCYTH